LISCTKIEQENNSKKFYETTPSNNSTSKTTNMQETPEQMKERILANPEIEKNKALGCKIIAECDNLVAVNCKAEMDGPLFYVEKSSGEVVERCGGYCINPLETGYCKICPPEEWTCTKKFELK